MKVQIKSFGHYKGQSFDEIFIENKHGVVVSFSDLGARINRWQVPNADGTKDDIILGYDDANQVFEGRTYYYGATIGRIAGRIKQGKFCLNNQDYQLDINNNDNHLHGGADGYDIQKWHYEIVEEENSIKVIFNYTEKDGTSGFPADIYNRVTHTFDDDNNWTIDYYAESSDATIYNPTNHVYFNLNGSNHEAITNHLFEVKASHYLPTKEDAIPTGEIERVDDTPFDLRSPVKFGDLLSSDHPQFKLVDGFDHPFVLDNESPYALKIEQPDNKRSIIVTTDRPIVVIYTHSAIPVPMAVWGHDLEPYAGVAIELQAAPDAINRPQFGNVILEKGDTFTSTTRYHLSL